LRTILDNLATVLAVELLSAARGLQLRAPLTPSPAGQAAVAAVARVAGVPGPDAFLAPVLEGVRELVTGRELRDAVEASTGPLA
jgi:histidine ammonia-lyase